MPAAAVSPPERRGPRLWCPNNTGRIPDAKFGFVTDIWSPAPNIPPANPGTTALVKGIQKMGIQMDRMAGGKVSGC